MSTDNTPLYQSRPGIWDSNKSKYIPYQEIDYNLSPSPYSHKYYEDKLAILVCQIKIWEPKGLDWYDVPDNCLIIRECENIEISDSAKELVNKAIVSFPRGTVISVSSKINEKVKTGNVADDTETQTSLKDATNSGDVMSETTSQYADNGVSTTPIAINYDDKGLISFNRSKEDVALLSPNDVAIGNRIEIRLGYAYSEQEFKKMNTTVNHPDLTIAFTGFITSISASTPLELECTNMAHVLTCISTPNIPASGVLTVHDFLDDDGKYHLLKGTGISLAPSCRKSQITVTGGEISENLTVADVLSAWSKSGITCMMELTPSGIAQLKVGWSYNTGLGGGELPNNDKSYVNYNGGVETVKLLQFDWDVAEDKLSLKNVDKKYIAIEAHARTKAHQIYKVTVRKNPDIDEDGWVSFEDGGDWQVINVRETKKVKKKRIINGAETNTRLESHIKDRVNMSKYSVIPYFSPKVDISKEELIEEAKRFWTKHNPNGLSGNLVIFGDVDVRPTETIGLIDMRFPQKNGYYYVEQVDTIFGVNGYRRELKIPYKVAGFKNIPQYII